MKTVPYTTSTGIKIGSRYGEYGKRAPIDDKDMIFIQEALLATPEYAFSMRMNRLAIRTSIVALFFVIVGLMVIR